MAVDRPVIMESTVIVDGNGRCHIDPHHNLVIEMVIED